MNREAHIRSLTSKGMVDHEQAVLIVRVIAGGADGDRAVDPLFRRDNSKLWHCLRAMIRNDDDVEDCLQETKIRVTRKLADFRGDSQFSTWCVRFAKLVALEFIRKRDRIRDHEVIVNAEGVYVPVEAGEIESDPIKSDQNPAGVAEEQEMEDLINELLRECQDSISRDPKTGKLDPLLRCLAERWIEAYDKDPKTTLKEVADACGTDTSRADRARKKLQNCIKAKVGMEWIAGAGERQ